eukprot:5993568-Prymnesium_polylepis.1
MDVASVQQGPLQLQDMRALYDAGAVHDGTFVWNETMGDWDTYGRCQRARVRSAAGGRGGRWRQVA